MYSPKIKERYIPILYRLSKLKGITMTKLVNSIINEHLEDLETAARQLKAKEITNEMFKKRGWKTGKETMPSG